MAPRAECFSSLQNAYERLAIYRPQVIIPFGLASMCIQAFSKESDHRTRLRLKRAQPRRPWQPRPGSLRDQPSDVGAVIVRPLESLLA